MRRWEEAMLYSDALYYARRGYKVRRFAWREGGYAEGVETDAGVWLRYVGECATRGDMTATDWDIIPQTEKP
jgi:hypothetical protein